MSTKDYIYLGLLTFAAIIFYLHGWYSGAQERSRRKPERTEPAPLPEVSVFVTTVDTITTESGRIPGSVRSRTCASEVPVHCFFGNN